MANGMVLRPEGVVDMIEVFISMYNGVFYHIAFIIADAALRRSLYLYRRLLTAEKAKKRMPLLISIWPTGKSSLARKTRLRDHFMRFHVSLLWTRYW